MSGKPYLSLNEGIAVIGIGSIYPQANTRDEYWSNILNKVNAIVEVPRDRWDIDLYYDPDKSAPDKTYTRLGGFTNNVDLKQIYVKYKIPPLTVAAMDRAQAYAIIAAGEALEDSGYTSKKFDRDRTAVIVGNSMGGDQEDLTNLRVFHPYISGVLEKIPSFSTLDNNKKASILKDFEETYKGQLPKIGEDSMPGELSNVIAGRIANTFNLRGQNCTVDAACASSLAALTEAVRGLRLHDFDMVVCGGSDFMMGPGPYVKFCKIGALSGDGSFPFDARANGFVMGEGVGMYILKRVSDARRDGDRIYAVIRSIGSSSDGKGKSIAAPNPDGQLLAINRAFESAGYGPETVQLVEAHGTSTSVGDPAEVDSLLKIWKKGSVNNNSVGLGSVKSMIGHLKAGAGAASIIKMSLALHNRVMPPSINFETPNPAIKDYGNIPFRVITNPEEWLKNSNGNPRRGNVSAFGFGGTNYHVALEEDTGSNGMPEDEKKFYNLGTAPAGGAMSMSASAGVNAGIRNKETVMVDKKYSLSSENRKKIESETIVIGGDSREEVIRKIDELKGYIRSTLQGDSYSIRLKDVAAKTNPQSTGRDVIAALSAESLDDCMAKLDTAREAINEPRKWLILMNKGIYFGENLKEKRKNLGKLALQFPGQGSQYANMLKDLYNKYAVVKETFDEGDAIMRELIGETLTNIIFVPDDASDEEIKKTEAQIRRTEITQPAILMVDYALYRLLGTFGIKPEVVIGHSLGEYGALISSGVLTFRDALISVAARGKEITNLNVEDCGKMASISTECDKVEEVIKDIDGYVIPANKNCYSQTVIGGKSKAVEEAVKRFTKMGIEAREIPVSHAFHSEIVALACDPYRRVLEKLNFNSPQIDIVANIDGEYYPKGDNIKEKIVDILVKHIASPVEFIKQIERMYNDGVRMFIEAGPKKTLTSFVQNIAGKREHLAVATNHPKRGGVNTFNDALAAMAAYGMDLNWSGIDQDGKQQGAMEWRYRPEFIGKTEEVSLPAPAAAPQPAARPVQQAPVAPSLNTAYIRENIGAPSEATIKNIQEKQKDIIKNILEEYSRQSAEVMGQELENANYYKQMLERYNINFDRILVSGISVGLPGSQFDVFENSFDRVLNGMNMIETIPQDQMRSIMDKKIVRLVKGDGSAHFETINEIDKVVKLAGRMGRFDFEKDYGPDKDFADSLDISTKLAIAAGIRALRDAGIPLVQYYKDTSTGGILPTHWGLPEEMSEETGVIFASAFPGIENFIHDISQTFAHKYGSKAKAELIELYQSLLEKVKDAGVRAELTDWYTENYQALKGNDQDNLYEFNRKFLFRMLALGHAQFAYFIKAKGPNVQVNTACSSTVTAVSMAEDWIRTGRAKRVIVIGADAATSNIMIEWILSAFLALGALTTEGDYRNAAVPFDKRRNGMIAGMGAVGMVIEAESELKKRGIKGIVELIATEFGNNAFHVTRLDVKHIASVMDRLMNKVERIMDVRREDIADKTVFMSHETYTPARGGSASAEVESLRNTFGNKHQDILVTNTKGFTGHPMGAGIEDAIIVKALQTAKVPPIANYKVPDPELGQLNLSKGGEHKERIYGLRLAAGFGSQIAMTFMKLESRDEDRIYDHTVYNAWLSSVSGFASPQLEVVNNTLRIKDDVDQVRRNRKAAAQPQPAAPQPVAQPVQAAVSTPAPAALTPAVSGTKDMVRSRISTIVAEKTGYPEEMIEFDLDMESDLGIDTVKQAEMFGLIRESFNIPVDENLKIKDYPTLDHVVQFVLDKAPGLPKEAAAPAPVAAASVSAPAVQAASAPVSGGADDMIRAKICAIVAEKTGYPEDMIEFDLDMESDLGIDTVKQAEMFGLIRESFNIPADENLKIKDYPTLGHVVQFVKDKAPDLPKEAVAALAPVAAATTAAPVPQAPAAVPHAVPASEAGSSEFIIRSRVSAIVAEKTGYPEDMIEFDLDMESDLGIDTVKQAEMFGMFRDAFSIPMDENLKIKDYPTLNHVVQFIKDRAPGLQDAAPAPVSAAAVSAPAPAAPAVQAAPAQAVGGADDMIRAKICAIVAEKTGYPEDMIEFDLDMESDLGIDTVKQAEMFGMFRDAFSIPMDENLKIKDYPTLNHVVQFVKDRAPGLKDAAPASAAAVSAPAPAAPAPQAAVAGGNDDMIRSKICAIVAEKTGYPEDMIEFDLDMESDLGIDTVKQAEMFGMFRDAFNIPMDENLMIKDYPTLNHVVQFVKDRAPGLQATAPAPAAAASAPAPAASASQAASSQATGGADDMIRAKICAIVAEKTGYPEDMIEFDLDMESDLGIDTVKQAEMFGMFRDAFSIPMDENLMIKDYPTLNHVVQFVKDRAPGLQGTASPTALAAVQETAPVAAQPAVDTSIKRMVLEVVEGPLAKDAPDTMDVKGMNILITDDGKGIAKALEKAFSEGGASVETIDMSKATDEEKLQAEIDRIQKDKKLNAIVHLAGMNETKPFDQMDLKEWRTETFKRVKSLFMLAKAFQKDLVENGASGRAFIVSLTGMGGTFGIEKFEAVDPIGGGITGLTKGLNKELAGVTVKSIDVNTAQKPQSVAKNIMKELAAGGSRVEIGYVNSKRMVTQVAYKNFNTDAEPINKVKEGSVFVVTGGGYGITAEIAKDMAEHLKVSLALVSLEQLPDNVAEIAAMNDAQLEEFNNGIIAKLKESNERVTPVMIQKETGKYAVAADIYRNIQEMKKLGAPDVEYYSCNVMDHDMMAGVIDKIRERFGSIDGIIHGAGMEQSKLMEDKRYEDFSLVVDVKADGAFNLLNLTKKDKIKYFVPFASISGRFGNMGQTDYSAANDMLNKFAEMLHHKSGQKVRAASMNWAGWRDVGMATRGSIAKIFEESGVDMIPKAVGVTKVREELVYDTAAEVVVAGRVGDIDCDSIIVGNRGKDFVELESMVQKKREQFPLIEELVEYVPETRIVTKKKLDLDVDVYLKDHAPDGVPFFPAVMGIEMFSEAAYLLFPDKHVASMSDVEFKYPIKLLKNEPVEIITILEVKENAKGKIKIEARVESEFFNKAGIKLGENRLHFVASMVLGKDKGKLQQIKDKSVVSELIKETEGNGGVKISDKEIYKRFFHGPKFQVHGGVLGFDKAKIVGKVSLNGNSLFTNVKRPRFITNPLMVEAALQNAGILGMVKENISSLPDAIGEFSFIPVPKEVNELYALAEHVGAEDGRTIYQAHVVDKDGNVYSTLKNYKMITTGELNDDERFK